MSSTRADVAPTELHSISYTLSYKHSRSYGAVYVLYMIHVHQLALRITDSRTAKSASRNNFGAKADRLLRRAVEPVYELAVFLIYHAALDLQRRGHLAAVDGELFGQERDAADALVVV